MCGSPINSLGTSGGLAGYDNRPIKWADSQITQKTIYFAFTTVLFCFILRASIKTGRIKYLGAEAASSALTIKRLRVKEEHRFRL